MKSYSVVSITGAPFARCGILFGKRARTVTVGDGGDLSDEQFAWLKRAADCEGAALSISELKSAPAPKAAPEESDDEPAPTTRSRSKRKE